MNEMLQPDRLKNIILTVRGEKVILASDLAKLFGVETKRLNEQVKRNLDRFPPDFMFLLNKQEFRQIVVANCDRNFNMMRTLPYAFTEHGALQAANVLNSPRAVEMSIYVVRAFIAMRRMTVDLKALADKVAELDKKYGRHDEIIHLISQILFAEKPLSPAREFTKPEKKKIGFEPDKGKGKTSHISSQERIEKKS